ncbi:hypothetical protein DAPPUDRAFT_241050 [Daphnia pulex]|uniref:Uncharacterized protein n=1 Tax=Daphnia pulex TaxID=6669 RepID=E9GDA6_DAPPU|nr:hypothetical protein DAPPUDRAFT_241050 [Daphnia pulex]|eukprot:EFX82730.1 hypothetical protein DAPPUDRAFT_241050 [Daphnia pulex]
MSGAVLQGTFTVEMINYQQSQESDDPGNLLQCRSSCTSECTSPISKKTAAKFRIKTHFIEVKQPQFIVLLFQRIASTSIA